MASASVRFLVLVSTLLMAFPAFAQTPTDDELARSYFNLGTAQLDRGDYEDAVRSFELSYRYSGRSALLFNLYVASERLGNLEAAVDYLGRYLASDATVENRPALETRLENLRRRLEAQRSGRPDPGPTAVEADANATDASATNDPNANAADAATATSSATTAPPSTRSSIRLVPLLLWSGAGASAVSFTVAAFLARAEDQRLSDLCDVPGGSCTQHQVVGLRRRDIAADTSLGLTVGLAATALVVQLVTREDEPAVAIAPRIDAQSAGVVVGGRF